MVSASEKAFFLVEKRIISSLKFTKSKIWQEMIQAKEVQREKPFYIAITANEIYKRQDNIKKSRVGSFLVIKEVKKKISK